MDEKTVTIEFMDGAKARITSQYEGALSDVTPGEGIEPPIFEVTVPLDPRLLE